MDLVNKQAEYYDSYSNDNPSYWDKMRAYTDARCNAEGVDRLDWENWKYVHKTVYIYIQTVQACSYVVMNYEYWAGRHYNCYTRLLHVHTLNRNGFTE